MVGDQGSKMDDEKFSLFVHLQAPIFSHRAPSVPKHRRWPACVGSLPFCLAFDPLQLVFPEERGTRRSVKICRGSKRKRERTRDRQRDRERYLTLARTFLAGPGGISRYRCGLWVASRLSPRRIIGHFQTERLLLVCVSAAPVTVAVRG